MFKVSRDCLAQTPNMCLGSDVDKPISRPNNRGYANALVPTANPRLSTTLKMLLKKHRKFP